MIKTGKFVTFEGGPGVGKTTQVNLVADLLNKLGYETYITQELGKTGLSESIRKSLSQYKLDALTGLFLVMAARRDHFVNIIKPKIEKGIIVLCDCFYDSTIVYYGVLKKIPIDKILEIQEFAIGNFEPNLTILLDLDYKTALYRSQPNNDSLLLEDNYKLINESYKKLAQVFSNRIKLIKSSSSKEIVAQKIADLILKQISGKL